MRIQSQLRSIATLAFVLLIACSGGQGGDPGTALDSGVTGGAGGAAGASGGSGGSGGGAGAVGGTGGCDENPIGAGLASADLDTEALRVRPVAALDGSHGVPSTRVMRSRPGGLLVRGKTGFWDIELDAEPRWFESSTLNYDLWSVDLDGDEDSDVVTQEPATVADSEADAPETIRYVLKLWERVGDELIARTKLPASHDPLADRHAVGDVDGDGDSDFVTFDRGRVIVHRNDGELAFTRVEASARVEDHVDEWYTQGLLIADRNDDGAQDLLVLAQHYYAPGHSDAMVFLGDGEAGFLPPTVTEVLRSDRHDGVLSIYNVQLGDVTGDGLADIVMEPRRHPGDHFLAESLDANTVAEARSLGHVGLLLELVDFDEDGTLDIAGRSYERFFIDVALGAGAFETRWFDLTPFDGIRELKVALSAGGSPRLNVVYRFGCPKACASECADCVFDACIECLSDADCTQGPCVSNACVDGEPTDDDAGLP
jgi:hypothetical protein